jgi:Uma2 family endonuclease
MAETQPKLATYEDLKRYPEGEHVEIVDGEIYCFPNPLPRHEHVVCGLVIDIAGAFDRGRSGPEGWWILTSVDVELERHSVVQPDLAGWRRQRMADFPETRPIRVRPDWTCEVLSPSNARHDLIRKADLYLRNEVPFYWLVDPDLRVLTAYERSAGSWLRLGAWGDGDRVRIRPFEDVELDVGRLFAPPPAGEVHEAVAAYAGEPPTP